MYQNQHSENRRTTTITLFEVGELHPLDAIACFDWRDSEAAYFLDLSVNAIKSYRRARFNPTSSNKRSPSSKTLRRTWERCKMLLDSGLKPTNPEDLPAGLQNLQQL